MSQLIKSKFNYNTFISYIRDKLFPDKLKTIDIKSLILNTKYISVRDYIINICMVYKKYRPSTLLEPANIRNEINNDNTINYEIKKAIDLANYLNLYIELDDIKRVLISNIKIDSKKLKSSNEKYIGKMLGFNCLDHDFENKNLDFMIGNIYITILNKEIGVYAEGCEAKKTHENYLKKHLEKLSKKYSKLLTNLGITHIVRYEIIFQHSNISLLEKLKEKNYTFINNNIGKYDNCFWNEFGDESQTIKILESKQYPKYIKIITFLFDKVFVKNDFDKYYPLFNGKNSKEIANVKKKAVKFEKMFYSAYNINNDIDLESLYKNIMKSIFKVK